MFDRVEIKRRAKTAFQANYWKCVLAAFLISLLTTGSSGSNISYYNNQNSGSLLEGGDVVHLGGGSLFDYLGIYAVISGIIVVLLEIFVFNVIEVGGDKFFVENSHGNNPSVGELFAPFSNGNYLNIVKILFMRDLYTFLWSLLLIIPGIVKSYEYMMIPYLLAENPSLSQKEVFARSKEMMTGNKMNAFVLQLSFLGWDLLSVFTLGFLELFYVSPYKQAAEAELYNYLNIPVDRETVNPDIIDADTTDTYTE